MNTNKLLMCVFVIITIQSFFITMIVAKEDSEIVQDIIKNANNYNGNTDAFVQAVQNRIDKIESTPGSFNQMFREINRNINDGYHHGNHRGW